MHFFLILNLVECGTGFLNRRHFEFYHGDAPCFKFYILNLNFPPFLQKIAKSTMLPAGFEPGTYHMWGLNATSRPTSFAQKIGSKFNVIRICGGKFKLGMSNLKQGASPWEKKSSEPPTKKSKTLNKQDNNTGIPR